MGLVQLCETLPPAGGYGHTFGIEAAARAGRIRSRRDLAGMVSRVLEGAIGPADGVASGIAFRHARAGSFEALPEVCAALSSERVPADMRLASVQMGTRLWAVSRGWGWAMSVHEQLDPLAEQTELHHAVAFGALVSETTSSQVRAIATYLFNVVKGMVMAAVRAAPLDEMEGHRVLSEVQGRIAELAATYADREAGEIGVRG
ncbi:MAG TPA: urease accessory UreF family protein [Phycisphaerae bacterium]|nr:urease accessory UreF family protein [Phycisphaerae bacterium]